MIGDIRVSGLTHDSSCESASPYNQESFTCPRISKVNDLPTMLNTFDGVEGRLGSSYPRGALLTALSASDDAQGVDDDVPACSRNHVLSLNLARRGISLFHCEAQLLGLSLHPFNVHKRSRTHTKY